MYEVRKKFMADGRELMPGTLVDASTWRNREALIAQRYIFPTDGSPSTTPKAETKQAVGKLRGKRPVGRPRGSKNTKPRQT